MRSFTHIIQGCVNGIDAIVWLTQYLAASEVTLKDTGTSYYV